MWSLRGSQAGSTLEVTRIFGTTAATTAKKVAEFVPASYAGSVNVARSYRGTNADGGNGEFNDTTGEASTTPSPGSLKTAILATQASFQDAESASVMAYYEHFPVLLTTPSVLSSQAAAAISKLGIEQVIVMGGQIAISNGVLSNLEGLGVSVLRIAGQDATDTAVQLADFEVSSDGLDWGALGVPAIAVARGDLYSDGLAGAAVAAGEGSSNRHEPEPLLLTENPTVVGAYLGPFLEKAGTSSGIAGDGQRVSALTVLGGPLAITTGTVDTMEDELGL